MDVDKLINAVANQPVIWDKRMKSYSNRQIVDKAWKEISLKIKCEESLLRRKWKYLRDYFVSELGRLTVKMAGPDGCGDKPLRTSRWRYFSQLLFLKDVVTFKSQVSETLTEQLLPAEHEETFPLSDDLYSPAEPLQIDLGDIKPEIVLSENGDATSEAMNCTSEREGSSERSQQKKRKNDSDDNRDTLNNMSDIDAHNTDNNTYIEKSKRSENPTDEDDDLLYLKSILPFIRMIPHNMKLNFRNRINSVVAEFVFNDKRIYSQEEYQNDDCN